MTYEIERYEAWRTAHLVPAETAAPELGELETILQQPYARPRRSAERLTVEAVHDAPW